MAMRCQREHLEVGGIVQGVGFRPFVHRLALSLGVRGTVANHAGRVVIEAEGSASQLTDFRRRLVADAPPLAMVLSLVRSSAPLDRRDRFEGFRIIESDLDEARVTLIPPDTAPCAACVAEMDDPADRRFGHAFITCTDCGPRYTIVTGLPYDRPRTTMHGFPLCPRCAEEYRDPDDRRHHAQPIACHDCGPRLGLATDGSPASAALAERGPAATRAAIDEVRRRLRSGETVAVKGVGGYHLACDATDDAAVARLRARKHRPDKSFAVLVADLATARQLAHVDPDEAELLVSPARPIVLLEARDDAPVAPSVAPGNPVLGVMLPPSPLHRLLVEPGEALVLTSANHAGEAICIDDSRAFAFLGSLADAVLWHDRPIATPCDDSVVRLVDGRPLPIRRARGYAPLPVRLPIRGPITLAAGADLKNTCCWTSPDVDGSMAVLSQHHGDVETLAAVRALDASASRLADLLSLPARPERIVTDAHPDYRSTRWAAQAFPDLPADARSTVQHHRAHVASVVAEHQLSPSQPVIGFACDGTGYAGDGTVWGGELFAGSVAGGLRRVAHLRTISLPGGDVAVRHPARVALAYLAAFGIPWHEELAPVALHDHEQRQLLRSQLTKGVACVGSSSMGRFFDAMASLCGLRHEVSFEAQAALDLEFAARRAATDRDAGVARRYRFDLRSVSVADALGGDRPAVIDPARLVAVVVDDLLAGVPVPQVALGIHEALADVFVAGARACAMAGVDGPVVLSGGVFQNALLAELARRRLNAAGFDVLTHRLVPPNDGGLALGQAYLALAAEARDHPTTGATLTAAQEP